MILGVGTDIVDIRRIEKLYEQFGDKLLERLLHDKERRDAKISKHTKRPHFYAHLAKRYAAKEAVAKALGTGIGKHVSFTEVLILKQESGQPYTILKGNALKRLDALAPEQMKGKVDISLSDDFPYAQAFAVISATPQPDQTDLGA